MIGFVGVGIMGKGMLKNLFEKLLVSNAPDEGFVIWNRNKSVCEEFISQYNTSGSKRIRIADTAADVVKSCGITFSMLSTLDASIDVFDNESNGLLSAISPGKILVDCATLSPERMMFISDTVHAKGGLFLEAPVSGSKVPAETGQLIFLCGGDEDVFKNEVVSQSLDAMGKAKFYFGPVGQGSRVKLVVNMIMGTMMSAFSEGLALGKASDIPLDSLLQVLDLGAMSNPMFRGKGPAMIAGNFPTNFPLKHQQKDMRLALELAAQKGVELPTSRAANDNYLKAMAQPVDAGDEDFSAVFKAIP